MSQPTTLIAALESVMPRRHAGIVEAALNNLGIDYTYELDGYHIPAHFSTDLRGVTNATVLRLEKLLHKHGAVLVK